MKTEEEIDLKIKDYNLIINEIYKMIANRGAEEDNTAPYFTIGLFRVAIDNLIWANAGGT